jgi:amidase
VLGAAAGSAVSLAAGVASAAPDEVSALDARALQRAIRSREVSCVEVMRACLRRIEALNPRFNAIVSLRDERVLLSEAAQRDDQLRRGEAVGPLHGFPHAVKDLAPLKGVRFTAGGSPLLRDHIATTDSLPTARARAAGVVFIGKTNAPEFGLGSHTVNRVFGATHNAYDESRSAGGSSGGAAVALALRMVPLADGSDYGGSLRNPAGWNGVCGFRTSYGRVPDVAADAWIPSMGTAGPMARNIADLALLLSVQAGPDRRAPLCMESPGAGFDAPIGVDVKGARVGWLGDFGGAAPTDPEVLAVCRSAVARFSALGCSVEDCAPAFDVERAWQAFITLRAWQTAPQFAPFAHDPAKRALLNPQAQFELALSERQAAPEIVAAAVTRTAWSGAFDDLFARFDIVVAPTAQLFPFPIAEPWPDSVAGTQMRTYHEWMKGVCLVTMAGTPSLAMPAGLGAGGLPIGVQIIAPVHQEARCLRFAAALEAASPPSTAPPVLRGG